MSMAAENPQSATDPQTRRWLGLADRLRDEKTMARGIFAAKCVAILLTLYVVLATWILFLYSRGYIDYCEGLVLFHQTRAAAGENIYDAKFRSAPLYSLPMYGPVFYYLLAPAGAVYPALLPGRVVSMLSLLAISGLSWRLLRRRFGASRWVAAVAAVPWLALLGPLYFGVNNRVDPFSVFLGVSALFAVNSPRPKVWLASIPLLILAGFTRATAAVAPGLAIFVVLLCDRRFKDAILLSASVALAVLAILALGDFLSSGNFSQCLIFTNGSVPLKKAYLTSITGTVCKQGLLPAGAIAALFLLRDRSTRLFGLHAVLSFTLAVVTSAKMGSHVNYFIEPSWSAGLSLALLLTAVRKPALLRLATVATCVLLIQSGVRAEKRMRGFYEEMGNFPGLMNLVETYGSKGPILTLESGAQVFAGQQVYVADLHIFTRLNEVGKFDLTPILDNLRQHRLAAVIAREDILPGFPAHSNWTPEMRQVVAMHYRSLEEYAGYTVYVPRETPLAEEIRTPADETRWPVDKTFYANGRKATEVTVVNRKKDGIEREWDDRGRLLRETTYAKGKMVGPNIRWYENGTMASRTDYARDSREGAAITWHPNGRKWTEARYKAGVLQGEILRWDAQGQAEDDAGTARLAGGPGSEARRASEKLALRSVNR